MWSIRSWRPFRRAEADKKWWIRKHADLREVLGLVDNSKTVEREIAQVWGENTNCSDRNQTRVDIYLAQQHSGFGRHVLG